ncbi:MAG: hypothetical protein EBW42_01870 [Rhodobacterales bacterium]|nr:hypothetical protein [Rhodobacterales bacterium]
MPMFILLFLLLSVLGGVGAGGWWYYQDTQERLAIYAENQAKLEEAVESSQATIKQMNADIQQQQALNKELQTSLTKATEQQDKLRRVLSKRDLSKDALKDPKNLEERMNNATTKVFARIESLTGNSARQRMLEQQESAASQSSDKDGVPAKADTASSASKAD